MDMDPRLHNKHFRHSTIMMTSIKNVLRQFYGLVPEFQEIDQAFLRICQIFGRAFPLFNNMTFSIHDLVEQMVKVFFQEKNEYIGSVAPFQFEGDAVSAQTRLSTSEVCDVVLNGPMYDSEDSTETTAMFLAQNMCQLLEGAERPTEYQVIANTTNFMAHVFSAFCTLVSEVQAGRVHTEPLNIRVWVINEDDLRELENWVLGRPNPNPPPPRRIVPVDRSAEVLRTWPELRADAGAAPAAPAAPPPAMLPEQSPTLNSDQQVAPGPESSQTEPS